MLRFVRDEYLLLLRPQGGVSRYRRTQAYQVNRLRHCAGGTFAMDQTVNYADILTQVLYEESKFQPSFHPRLKIVSSCDRETGQFLLIMVGWDKEHWRPSILFHAQLIDGQVIIEADNTEDITQLLVEAGIRSEDIVSGA
ncbi:MAG TPA: element excision factor XisI family protein, partial [Blastocatellia bacterium]|nr:element excision factor XisI family protein [Blastocatellia bacterium]